MNARFMRRGLAALIGVAVVASAGHSAVADDDLFVVLDYDVGPNPAGCPSAMEFQRAVGRHLGYDPFREHADKRMVVRVDATAHGLEGGIEWRNANGDWEGERKVSSHGRDCTQLVRAMTFAVAVQIQLLAATRPPTTTTATTATTATTPRSPSVADSVVEPVPAPVDGPAISNRVNAQPLVETPAPAPTPVPMRRRSLAFGLGFGPSAGFGLGPGLSLDSRLFANLRLGRGSVELGAKGAWPSTLRQSDGSGFTQYRFAITVAGCGHLDRWSGCILGEMGQTRVRGFGVDAPRSSSGTTALAGLRLAMTQNVTDDCYVLAHADVSDVLTPWTVTLNHADAWTVPRLAAAIGIDLALRFQ